MAVLLSGCAGSVGGADLPVLEDEASTPEAVVEAFLAAAQTRDAALIGSFFSDFAPGEFQDLRNGAADAESLEQLARATASAKVLGSEPKNDCDITVRVSWGSREERIWMVRTNEGWRILDF